MDKAPPCPVTTEEQSFRNDLEEGDVLLFDTLSLASQIIKTLENSPVNHCALYTGDGKIIHVGHTSGEAAKGEAAHQDDLLKHLLAHREIRTVTALRHTYLDNGLGAEVIKTAKRYLHNATYGYTDLLGLGAECINRAYAAPWPSSVRWVVRALSKAAQDLSKAWAGNQPAEFHLTCSEFVYNCYDLARPGCMKIVDPLARGKDDAGSLGGKPRYARGSTGTLPVASTDLTRSPVGTDMTLEFRSSDHSQMDREFERALEDEQAQILADMDRAVSRGKYGWDDPGSDVLTQPISGSGPGMGPLSPAPRPGAPYAGAITPWDLWASPTLEVVRVLHFPPILGDPLRDRKGKSRKGT